MSSFEVIEISPYKSNFVSSCLLTLLAKNTSIDPGPTDTFCCDWKLIIGLIRTTIPHLKFSSCLALEVGLPCNLPFHLLGFWRNKKRRKTAFWWTKRKGPVSGASQVEAVFFRRLFERVRWEDWRKEQDGPESRSWALFPFPNARKPSHREKPSPPFNVSAGWLVFCFQVHVLFDWKQRSQI